MRMKVRQQRKQALWNWLRWMPVVAFPMLALFADAWLQTQSWHRDFELGRLAEQRKALTAALSEHAVAAASLHDLDRLEYMAANLGLMEPDPTQIVTINAPSLPVDSAPFAVASTRPAGKGDSPAFPETPTPPEAASAALTLLEDIPDSAPVRGISLVTLEAVEDDLDTELLDYNGGAP